jgi:hypothetical protein
MHSSSRTRRSTAPRGVIFAAGVVGLLSLPATGAVGCGRLGFDVLPLDGAEPPVDASVDRADVSDAVADGVAPADEGNANEADASSVLDADASSVVDAEEASCPVSTVVDYCNAIPPLPAAPVIDGVLDCGPALVPMTPIDWNGPPPLPPFPAGNATSFAVAWRPDGLYVFMAVTTPADFPADTDAGTPVFYGAGVELFLDDDGVYANAPTYDNPGTIQYVVAAPPDSTTIGVRAEGFRNAVDVGPWPAAQFGTFPTATGFVFEGFVVAADLGLSTWALASGQKVGFDVAVDVSFTTAAMTGPQGHRVGQYFFHVGAAPNDASAPAAPYSDPRAFCTPALIP